jgi:hypothetical protein
MWMSKTISRVVINDGHGGKDILLGRGGQSVGRMCPLAIRRVCVKTELYAQICFYVLIPVNTVG